MSVSALRARLLTMHQTGWSILPHQTPQLHVASELAHAALAGRVSAADCAERMAAALARKHRWVKPLAGRIFLRFGSRMGQVNRAALVEFIVQDAAFRYAWYHKDPPRIARYSLVSPAMEPRRGTLAACALPSLPTPGDIARWLGISIPTLDWFADLRGMNERHEGTELAHYRRRWIEKRQGHRLIEVPKPRLREFQRRILRDILAAVPVHAAAHGFVTGRSCITHVRRHLGKRTVLRMDLRQFFSSIPAARVHALFRTLGYPEASARVLSALCTTSTPARVLGAVPTVGQRHSLPNGDRAQLERRHLPQGAPTSPALANLCALHLDLRVDGLARSLDCDYTRYADDPALSGGEALRRAAPRLPATIAAIALEEGFEVNHRKTRAMHHSRRQVLTGLVINEKPNLRRAEFDRLKAILHNCAATGPTAQNREGRRDFRAHLAGRVAYLASVNPAKGRKLAATFARIDWNA